MVRQLLLLIILGINSIAFCPMPIMPQFEVGFDSIQKFIQHNLNWSQNKQTISGKAFVEFVVEIDGTISMLE